MEHRRTGRTFRMLLAAIGSASEGNNVVIVGHSHRGAMDLYQITRRIIEGYGSGIIGHVKSLEFQLTNGATIKFITYEQYDKTLTPAGGSKFFVDHYCFDYQMRRFT